MSQKPEDIQKEIDGANDVLTNEIYVPTFVKCCADAGVPITTEDQLRCALESVAILKAAEAAQPPADMHKAARDELFALVNEAVPDVALASTSRALANQAMRDTRIVDAVKTLRATA